MFNFTHRGNSTVNVLDITPCYRLGRYYDQYSSLNHSLCGDGIGYEVSTRDPIRHRGLSQATRRSHPIQSLSVLKITLAAQTCDHKAVFYK